jgi:hypothetical protein
MAESELLKTFINYVKDDLTQLKTDVKDLKHSNSLLQSENETLKNDICALKRRLVLAEGLNMRLNTKLMHQEHEITDLKCRSMRDNIIIKGVPEVKDEKWGQTKKAVLDVLKNKLQMPDVSESDIERAHRTGTKSGSNPRQIVAQLTPATRDEIFGFTRDIKHDLTYIQIREQVPAEVQEKRNRLWPKFIEAKKDPKNKVKWMTDKLLVNGQMLSANDENVDINPAIDINEDLEISHSEHKSEDGSTVMGHAVTISNQQDIPAVLAKLYQDRLIAAADHNMYAYRIGRSKNLKEGFFDDKEHGAGTTLLRMLQNDKRSNVMVVVTRWFGGKHIGPKRFDLFKECAGEALSAIVE